jgi:protein-S-isoprenylcysteine O-methyltransferase Ste14
MTVPDPYSAARSRPDGGDGSLSEEVLVGRLSWRPVARGIVGLGVLGVVLAGLGVLGVLSGESMFSVMGVLAVPSLALAAGLAFINGRARTRVAPEGIVGGFTTGW